MDYQVVDRNICTHICALTYHCDGATHWATGVKDRSNTQPRVSLTRTTFSPSWNGGIFGTYPLTGVRIRSYVPTQTSIQILGTQVGMFIIRRTRKRFFWKKCSKWDSNSCPRRCQMWRWYPLSDRGKGSIDYPAQGKPYNTIQTTYLAPGTS